MTNLTEQLATESLPEYTEFYVRKKDGSTDTQTWLNRRHSSAVEWWNTFNITEVLAPVPSYEEFQELKNANDSMFDTIKMLNKDNNKLEKENTKLKEVLKECKALLSYLQIDDYDNNGLLVLTKINKVLGEE